MRYQNVCLEACVCTLPEEIITSAEIEERLKPLYTRLKLPEGRLELMTGIRQRRFWKPGVLPSQKSIESGQKAIDAAGADPEIISALVHASVCRDFLEPATACGVHHQLGLPRDCLVYDVSNACLGMLNAVVQVANMIELGQIRAALVVGTESSRPLVETTIERLNSDLSLTREQVKLAIASLTIGSGSAAMLLVDRRASRTGNRLTAAAWRANTTFHDLCHSGRDEAVATDMRPLMQTDSEKLLHEGLATGRATFAAFLEHSGWTAAEIDKTFCHQVGLGHRKLMLEAFGIEPVKDFTTVELLGNTGSVAVPLTMALGIEQGHLKCEDHVALLGIGSGINSLMVGIEWQTAPAGNRRADDKTNSVPAPLGTLSRRLTPR